MTLDMTSTKRRKASQLLSPPLVCLNHVSFLCSSLKDSIRFYHEVLGFQLIKRPSSLHFPGAWLYNYGLGIHLLQRSSDVNVPIKKSAINPKDNHISFQCEDIEMIKQKLDAMQIQYVSAKVEDGGIEVEQLFFHDPDCNMIEICDCQKIPVMPLKSFPLQKRLRKH